MLETRNAEDAEEDVKPDGVPAPDGVPNDVPVLDETLANLELRFKLAFAGAYINESIGNINYSRSQNFLAKAMVPRKDVNFFSHSDQS